MISRSFAEKGDLTTLANVTYENISEQVSYLLQGVYIIRWDFNEGFLFHVAHRINLPLDGVRIR
jgi:ribulose bisphosphate carboxylase small subunit